MQRRHLLASALTFGADVRAAPAAELRWLSVAGQRRVVEGPWQRPFRWASVTKLVTAVLVLQAVEQGRWALQDPVVKHWPDCPLPAARGVSLRQLLAHESGLPVSDSDGFWTGRSLGVAADSLLFLAGEPLAAPGSAWRYNNGDYLLLGALLERLQGRPYAGLVAALMRRAGCAGVRLYRAGAVPPDHLQGRDDAQPVNPHRFGPTGGLYGTLPELAAFAHALLQGRLLGRVAWQSLTQANDHGAALSVWVYKSDRVGGAQVVERRGHIGSLRLQLLMLPARDAVAVVLTSDPAVDTDASWKGEGPGLALLAQA